jgi:hypothetical protein
MTEMMEIENLFRSTALAVGLKPSASQGEARLRGLERIIYSKTIISVSLPQLNLMGKVERSWELRAPRDDRNKFRSTFRCSTPPVGDTALDEWQKRHMSRSFDGNG